MEFNDKRCIVFKKLSNSKYISYNDWPKFIQDKDIGIICSNPYQHHYKIINQKKWMLAKIKYGI